LNVDFLKGVPKKKSFFNLFQNSNHDDIHDSNSKWEENKLRILLWGSIMKFYQNEYLGEQILKFHESRFIFSSKDKYWGQRQNVLGYVLTHTCYDIYYLRWKEPGDNNR